MNELLKINYETEQPTVSARDLHEKLEISKRFSVWFETNSKGFVEGQDYTSVLSGTVVNNGATRKIQDFNISTEMAKHICLMSRTEKGMQGLHYRKGLQLEEISDCKASRKNREQCCANHGRKACRSKLSVSESR